MRRVRVWIPSARLDAGERVQVLGPDETGTLDAAAGEPGGRLAPAPMGDGEHWAADGQALGPAQAGELGRERRFAAVTSRPLATGLHEFAMRSYDRQTGAAAGTTGGTVSVYVNTAPQRVRGLRPSGTLVSGRYRFTFTVPRAVS